MRPVVQAECTLKESAAINQILGRRVSNIFMLRMMMKMVRVMRMMTLMKVMWIVPDPWEDGRKDGGG